MSSTTSTASITANDEEKAIQKFVVESSDQWVKWDPNSTTLDQVNHLLNSYRKTKSEESFKALRTLFYPRIEFGTAGLRARVEAGYHHINDLVILQSTQGFLRYLQQQLGEQTVSKKGVVVGYDARYDSRRFAELVAAIFISQSIPVHFFSVFTPTPFVPFAVRSLSLCGGIMVTASHNPKDDNGYKVYWENGAQIIPPHDSGISKCISENLRPWKSEYEFPSEYGNGTLTSSSHKFVIPTADVGVSKSHHNNNDNSPVHSPKPLSTYLFDPLTLISERYFALVGENYCFRRLQNHTTPLKITYTAMHGVGAPFVTRALESFSLPPYINVPEQNTPNPDFPTVKFPNPEEGAGALAIAISTAERNHSKLILANDPDADRLAVAEKDPATGTWTCFNGNEIAYLFADWIWRNHRAAFPADDPSKCFMLNSTVSSNLLASMAKIEGFAHFETLTGFKWMGNEIASLCKNEYTFLFAYEVEIGFLIGDISLDKDGVRTLAVFYELAADLHARGSSCHQRLTEIYGKYGYFKMTTSYYFVYDKHIFDAIFERLRTMENGKYPSTIGPYQVSSVRDISLGLDTREPNDVCRLPRITDSYFITFRFEDIGAIVTLRNSGTEPKLKYYIECKANSPAEAEAQCSQIQSTLIPLLIEPQKYNLKSQHSS